MKEFPTGSPGLAIVIPGSEYFADMIWPESNDRHPHSLKKNISESPGYKGRSRPVMTASSHHSTAACTAGGTLLAILASIQSGDISKTIMLATIGAVVSFLVSLGLKWLAKTVRRG